MQTVMVQEMTLFTMPEVRVPQFPDRVVDITDYGAVGDGVTKNTEAIAHAINACAHAGGGTVVIPQGIWLTGPIVLKSNINLHADKGALIIFSRSYEDYPLIISSYEGSQAIRSMSPLFGEKLNNVAITGEGIFDGNGDAWRPVKRFKMTDAQWNALLRSGGVVDPKANIWWPEEGAMRGEAVLSELLQAKSTSIDDYLPIRAYLRPVLLSFRECTHVLLDGPTFQNSPGWNVHPWACEHITIRNVKIKNPWYAQNGDGLDLDSCKYALIENCLFDVGDDAICMKSGKNAEGRKLAKPVEFVTVRNCEVYHGHGGFVIGSEMSGGARNMVITDCTFIGTDIGLRFKSTRGRGGVVENIVIQNIRMKDIGSAAISFNMFYALSEEAAVEVPVSEETPIFRHIYIQNTQCIGAKSAIHLKGLPEMPIQQIVFENVLISANKGVDCTDGKEISFKNVTIIPQEGPVWTLKNSMDVTLDSSGTQGEADVFLHVSGAKTKNIACKTAQYGKVKQKLQLAGNAEASEITGIK